MCLNVQRDGENTKVHSNRCVPGRWEIGLVIVIFGKWSVVLLNIHNLVRPLSVKSTLHTTVPASDLFFLCVQFAVITFHMFCWLHPESPEGALNIFLFYVILTWKPSFRTSHQLWLRCRDRWLHRVCFWPVPRDLDFSTHSSPLWA